MKSVSSCPESYDLGPSSEADPWSSYQAAAARVWGFLDSLFQMPGVATVSHL